MDNRNNTMNFFVPETRSLDDLNNQDATQAPVSFDISMDLPDSDVPYTATQFGAREGYNDEYEEVGGLFEDALTSITSDLADLEMELFGDKAEYVAKNSLRYLNSLEEQFRQVTDKTIDLIDKGEITNQQADYIANAAYQMQTIFTRISEMQRVLIEHVDNYLDTKPDGTLLEEK